MLHFFCGEPYISSAGIGVEQRGRYRLDRILGEGQFGRVYLGYDGELQRQVAIKVPTQARFQCPEDAETYLAEARTVAALDHPHIVPVYDMGRTDDGSVYVVSRYVAGTTLEGLIKAARPPHRECAELVATLAMALHHAHQKRLIHRDIKPANILIDETSGTPFVTDFGLAVREEDYLKQTGLAGTPAYMSPEQARGEGHRLDGRSDLFSLGVILYELLTGKRPFRGGSVKETLQLVVHHTPQPPRALDDTIPAELERICLKSLSKRASDRYPTGVALADDLQEWLKPKSVVTACKQVHTITPRGLRSFTAEDADFFLDLLPGPRNRDGLPESIAFWKQRIEQRDPEQTFSVGLLYGPSGCGKSSLFRAGLIPNLDPTVLAICIEATPEETEIRLLRGLRRQLPDLPDDLQLIESLERIRRGSGPKVVLIIDQFEQWLYSHRVEPGDVLPRALRQCDGGRLQAILMIRDDFYLAAARLMNEIDVPILTDQNFKLVDLFDVDHAQNVLIRFGQAYRRLPEDTQSLSPEQVDFIRQVVEGLSEDGKVVSVRLALLAEMLKGRDWVPATLATIGGLDGIGFSFLEETFASHRADARHRQHQEAVRGVLRALLPESGSNIKGAMRSEQDLQEASGYRDRPTAFRELLQILDGELRLVTPTLREEGDWGRVAGNVVEDFQGIEGAEYGGSELSAVGGLAIGYGAGGKLLPGDEGFSEGRAVRPDQSNPKVGGIGAGELRRGTGAGAHQGILETPEHRQGIADGTGNPPAAVSESELNAANGSRATAGSLRPTQPDAQRTPQIPPQKTLATSLSAHHPPPSTHHSTPSPHHPRPTTHFQLTHDYLVPSLREWLSRKQRETKKGRAELKLAERATIWGANPENKQLPTIVEWFQIRWYTVSGRWTEPQRKMMRRAAKVHSLTWGGTLAALLVLGFCVQYWVTQRDWISKQQQIQIAAESLENNLGLSIPFNIRELRRLPEPLVVSELERRFETDNLRHKLAVALALAEYGRVEVDYLISRIDDITTSDTANLVDALAADRAGALAALKAAAGACTAEELWRRKAKLAIAALALGDTTIAADMCQYEGRPDPGQRTIFIHEFPQWEWQLPERQISLSQLARLVADSQDSGLRSGISLGVGHLSVDQLRELNPTGLDAWQRLISRWYAEHADSSTHSAAIWLLQQWQFPLPKVPNQGQMLAERAWFVNSVGMTMLRIEPPVTEILPELVVDLHDSLESWLKTLDRLRDVSDNDLNAEQLRDRALAYYQTGDFAAARLDLIRLLADESADIDDGKLPRYRVLSLARLGRHEEAMDEYGVVRESLNRSCQLYLEVLLSTYRDASAIALTRLGEIRDDDSLSDNELYDVACAAALGAQFVTASDGNFDKFKNAALELLAEAIRIGYSDDGQLRRDRDLVVLHSEPEFRKLVGHVLQRNAERERRIPEAAYWISRCEVTRDQFEAFIQDEEYEHEKPTNWFPPDTDVSPTGDHPAQTVTWYDAVMYCNWLSRREGKTPAYRKMPPRAKRDQFRNSRDVWELDANATGYRLPREIEWEYAARAGTVTDWSSGSDKQLLVNYCQMYPSKLAAVVGRKLPNAWGLHDMHGNVEEWIHDLWDLGTDFGIPRGGSWNSQAEECTSSSRHGRDLSYPDPTYGVRVALSSLGSPK